jgi:uncharacterized protein YggE
VQVKRLAIVFAVFIALVAAAAAQERPVPSMVLNTVYVGADGRFEAPPDTALLQFSIAAQDASSENAYSKAAQAADKVRAALRTNGIDPKTVEISHYSLQPLYDWKSAKRPVVGFKVTTGVSLKLKDFAKVGPLMTAFAAIDETDNQSVNYMLESMESAKQKAIEDAFNKAKSSAQTVARAGSRTLGQLQYSSVDTYEQPIPMAIPMMRAKAMSAAQVADAPTAEFTPQKVTVTAHVNAMFELK